jgi:hypothetical protein
MLKSPVLAVLDLDPATQINDIDAFNENSSLGSSYSMFLK